MRTPSTLEPVKPAVGAIHAENDQSLEVFEQHVVRKVSRRLIGFLFILFAFSFLDRINIGFAGLTMAADLKLTGTMFGMAGAVFYVTYVMFGIPSNLALGKIGARRWIATIMVAWGLASACTAFAHDASSLYLLRALVGMCEAGFLPGMLVYLTYWFPRAYRARANALFMIAMPVTTALGAAASGYLLRLDGVLGLAGWHWLFVVEGLPASLLGVAVWFYLDDKPADARWLTEKEKRTLQALLSAEASPVAADGGAAQSRESGGVMQLATLKFAVAYFCLVNSLSLVSMWVPQIVKSFDVSNSNLKVGLLSALPQTCTIVGMLAWGAHSDRRQERRWHLVLPMLFAAAGWTLAVVGEVPQMRLTGIAMASTGAYTAMAIFWTMPDTVLSQHAKAIGIAVINATGNIGSALSPLIVGMLKDVTHSFAAGLLYAVATLLIGSVIALSLPVIKIAKGGT
ncbi:MFS transporter [Burkholderia stagnalis]|uniref:MFS transporter n=1 Tax=Burkholderia stagnalis TaxID=1503054 RepID=UPI0007549B5A|nr:MFS transporter [Burkholderia stagnalis]KVN25262.1 4-hydroxyphenylacetate permease [Burkholderia stagnalis]KVN53484.1 4-hydroxyphenylacetate permease [Burkholderia stagnalis]